MKNVTTIILAGGQSKRMGRDKAFLKWKGKTFLRHILEFCDSVSNQIIISGNKNPEIYLKEAVNLKNNPTVIKDIEPYSGPLNGIISCLNKIEHSNVFIATCDTPALNKKIFSYLYNSLQEYHCVVPVIEGKFQPFNTFYTKEAIKIGANLYKKGIRSIYKWIENLNKKYISDIELKKIDEKLLMFKSINTQEEYVNFINTYQED